MRNWAGLVDIHARALTFRTCHSSRIECIDIGNVICARVVIRHPPLSDYLRMQDIPFIKKNSQCDVQIYPIGVCLLFRKDALFCIYEI